MLKELVYKNRSYRRFDQSHTITLETLRELIDLARHSASGNNLQPLKFILSADLEKNGKIFPHLGWAGYLKDWPGPAEGERPTAYIIILGDTEIREGFGIDHGIAAQSIMLGAAEKGLGGCIIGSAKGEKISEALDIPARFKVLLVLALGKPAEKVVIENLGADGDIRYYRDGEDVHHVPKRTLAELIIGE
ncbi:MAG: nitroreductase family protein [Anaerolineales bacterium]|jgi:nitroreductase|nr:nitroreductase family protein [Anaerolineales bacterium]